MTENQHNTRSVEISKAYASIIFNDFVKKVPKNFPNVTHCCLVRNKAGDYLRVIQSKKEHKLYFRESDPVNNLQDLKNLEDRMFIELND